MEFPDVLTWAVPVFVLLVVIEIITARFTGKGRYESKDAAASLVMGFGSTLAPLFGGAAIVAIAFSAAYEVRFMTIPNTWWAVALCFILDDLRYYWWHRIGHEYRWFWASHIVHHSSQHYNLTTAMRQTWTGQIITGVIFKTPLILMGFHPAMVIFVGGLNLFYQFWIHTEQIDRMGPFEAIFNTPSHHRVHHATNPKYLDKNYAGALIIWDKMFGTFIEEDKAERPRYGIVKNLGTFNPFMISFHEWIGMAKDVISAKSLKDAFGYMFGPPGWSPDGSRMTTAMIKQREHDLQSLNDANVEGESNKLTSASGVAAHPAE